MLGQTTFFYNFLRVCYGLLSTMVESKASTIGLSNAMKPHCQNTGSTSLTREQILLGHSIDKAYGVGKGVKYQMLYL